MYIDCKIYLQWIYQTLFFIARCFYPVFASDPPPPREGFTPNRWRSFDLMPWQEFPYGFEMV